MDIGISSVVAGYFKDGQTHYITQGNISDFRIEDSKDIFSKIIQIVENKFGFIVKDIVLSIPNHYTCADISKLRIIAEQLGLNLVKSIRRTEALAVYHAIHGNNENKYIFSIVNTPNQIDLHLMEYGDDVIESIYSKSFSDYSDIDLTEAFNTLTKSKKAWGEVFSGDELFVLCLCDSYKNQIFSEKVEYQCKSHLKNLHVIPCGEEQIIQGLCNFSGTLMGMGKEILLLQALTHSVGVEINKTVIGTPVQKDTTIPTKTHFITEIPPSPVTVSLLCDENSFGKQNIVLNHFQLPKHCCEKKIAIDIDIDASGKIVIIFKEFSQEHEGEGEILYFHKI
jgi:hypothetical protein